MTRRRFLSLRRKVHRDHEEADEESGGGELSLVPYLDIVSNLVMFLLMTATATASAMHIPVAIPAACTPDCSEGGKRQPLRLVVHLSPDGLRVATADGVLPFIPRGDGDLAALTRTARALKATHAGETLAVVSAAPTIPYQQLVAVMDALRSDDRGPLFPDVSLAAGVE
jgi:biopolymer transport protein TolR